MSICPCCGERPYARRPIGPGGRSTHVEALTHVQALEPRGGRWAGEALVACCLRAADHAVLASRETVELADLAIAVAMHADGRDALAKRGLSAADVAEAAKAAIESRDGVGAQAPTGRQDARIGREISADMLAVLERADAAARQHGGHTVDIGDVVEVLLERSGDLAGANFLARFGRDGRIGERRHRREHRATMPQRSPAPDERSRTVRQDPFQIRTDVGASLLPDRPVERPGGEAEASIAPAACGHALVDHSAFDVLGRQIRDGAAAQAELRAAVEQLAMEFAALCERMTAGLLRDESRDGGLAGELAALRVAFGELEARLAALPRAATAPPPTDDPRLDLVLERICGLEASLDRLSRSAPAPSPAPAPETRTRGRRAREHQSAWPARWRRLRRSRRGEAVRGTRGGGPTAAATVQQRWGQLPRQGNTAEARVASADVALDDELAALEAAGSEDEVAAKRFYLAPEDDIVCAPSIGPRTAARLKAHGIDTVADLLAADASDLAHALAIRHITAGTVEDWRMQARLVCTIPWLRGTHAQLLVGAGYTTAAAITEAAGDTLGADILAFAATREGQRILRNGEPPSLERIRKWAAFAAMAEVDRAA